MTVAAKEECTNFPHRILSNTNGSYRRQHRNFGNLKRIKEGTLPEPKSPSAPQKRAAEQSVARQFNKQ